MAKVIAVVPRHEVDSKQTTKPVKGANGHERAHSMIPFGTQSKVFMSVGILYIMVTLFGSYRFATSTQDLLANDYFWANYNSSYESYIANAFDRVGVWAEKPTELSLTDPGFTFVSAFPPANLWVSPTYGRFLQYHHLTDIETGIVGVRRTGAGSVMYTVTQYCWVDFDRRWSMAHTAIRAERCMRNHRNNAAVYMESFLRNVDWAEFSAAFGDVFEVGVQQALMESPDGRDFLEGVKCNASLSLGEEAAHWCSKGMTHFSLQYHNKWQLQVDEKVYIVNALGRAKALTTKHVGFERRDSSATTMKMFWGPDNDFWAVLPGNTRIAGMSLVRNSSMFFEYLNLTMEDILIMDGGMPRPFSPQLQLVRDTIGPFNSIDLMWKRVPHELLELLRMVTAIIYRAAMTSNEAADSYYFIHTGGYLTAWPWFWAHDDWLFAEGSLLCNRDVAVPYITRQFLFEDDCRETISEGWGVVNFYFIFSLLSSSAFDAPGVELEGICAEATRDVVECAAAFARAQQFRTYLDTSDVERIRAQAVLAHQAVVTMNVSIMQFVQRNASLSDLELQVAPVLATDIQAPWNALAWFFLIEWIIGLREVVTFEGDHGSLTLISAVGTFKSVPTNDIPDSLSTALRVEVQYVTFVLAAVAVMVLVAAVVSRFRVSGWNMLEFNRTCGVVWVGRPLLAIRGIVAMILLSTARPEFIRRGNLVQMEDTSHQWFVSIISAGEATWVLCVAIDLLLVVNRGWTFAIAPLTHAVVWAAVAILQLLAPAVDTMTVNLVCEFLALEGGISCVAGEVRVGDSKRMQVILLICAVALCVCPVVVRLVGKRDRMIEDSSFLPGIAQEMFERHGWVHKGDWFVDRASALMAGLVSVPMGSAMTVLDIKTWAVLRTKDAPGDLAEELRGAIWLRSLRSKSNNEQSRAL